MFRTNPSSLLSTWCSLLNDIYIFYSSIVSTKANLLRMANPDFFTSFKSYTQPDRFAVKLQYHILLSQEILNPTWNITATFGDLSFFQSLRENTTFLLTEVLPFTTILVVSFTESYLNLRLALLVVLFSCASSVSSILTLLKWMLALQFPQATLFFILLFIILKSSQITLL